DAIDFLVRGAAEGTIPDYQLAAWLMAVRLRGMSDAETSALTLAMAASGRQLDLSSIPGRKVDKHSTGGVGDKATLVVGPLVASVGIPVAKLSGRALGHSGGTLDKIESIEGFRVDLEVDEFISQVRRVGIAIAGQTADMVPADKVFYALRDTTGTVDSVPLIASSVMSKKLAAGADAIVLDVKAGRGAFVATVEAGEALAVASADGRALAKLSELIRAQGGDPRVVEDRSRLPQSAAQSAVTSDSAGRVAAIDALEVGLAVKSLGAGRDRKTDPIDLSVGLVLQRKVGDEVQAGETLAVVHARSADQAAAVLPRIRAAFAIAADARPRPLFLRRASAS